jgi:hypothetical protein
MLESAIERHLRDRVRTRGGMCIKLAPTIAGLPDRMVLLPDGRVYFVELKRPNDGEVSAIQHKRHRDLRAIGFTVDVLWSKPEVDEWLTTVMQEI